MSPFVFLAIGFLGLTLWLGLAHWQAGKKRTVARAGYFNRAAKLFDRVVVQVQPSGFARLTAHKGGHAFDLQVVQDSLTFRKLPALWVMVTLPETLPVKATLDIMARPSGNETFSKFASLPHSLERPDFLPDGIGLKSDDAAAVQAEYIRKYASVFDDPRVKELVISPKGLRLAILAEEADRGRYLIFRDSEMGAEPIGANRILPLLETILAMRTDILALKDT
jgi:hypothetical protein